MSGCPRRLKLITKEFAHENCVPQLDYGCRVALIESFRQQRQTVFCATAARSAREKQEKEEPKVTGEFGSKGNPVRCNGPRGERAYLSRLRCADGKAPAFNRIGSFGKGPYGHILDGYNVKCEDKDPVTVFMDMYHEHVEKEPVPGFTIVNDEP